ncbi:DNA-processing protein DprA [Herbiconiux sp. UC225_62]|uniref:DNA-processing protein DprA n=1 Tax=Herbiconiux sp. UC225_62 TaxID=3350168 RepID=UPI0036D3CF00
MHQLERSLVRSLVEAVNGGALELDDDAVARIFATATWSVLVEPGDGVAGMLLESIGADRALSMLIEGRAPQDWLAAAGEAGAPVELGVADLASACERWRPRLSSRLVVEALRAAIPCRARFVTPGDPMWPSALDVLGGHAPIGLWVRGDAGALGHPGGAIAIVGSRDATNYGEHVAMDLASGLSDRGFAVVSGAAYGIDGMAHRACLASRGTTIAFLAGGVDRLYPAAHHDLLLRIAASGAVVSELPCGSSPTKWRFLQRNRLIAAASQATVVVEAGRRSGSLNTAGHAAALGRPLGAVPGPVTSVTSAGCHRLLREYDAVCVTSAADVVEMVLGSPDARPAAGAAHPGPSASSSSTSSEPGRPSAAKAGGRATESRASGGPDAVRVLDALSARSPRGVPDLARRTGMAPRAVAVTLGVLALEGGAYENENGWLRL